MHSIVDAIVVQFSLAALLAQYHCSLQSTRARGSRSDLRPARAAPLTEFRKRPLFLLCLGMHGA